MRHGAPYITAMTLAIINREPDGGPIPPGVPVWRTCLREVLFSECADPLHGAGGTPLLGGRAYRLLLEILCGLQSPMIGETQVVAQFKGFLAGLSPEHAWMRRTGQRLLADARRVRTAHLQGLGTRSYGSAVRACIGPSDAVALVGTGKLAVEIIPCIAEAGRALHQWGRAPAVPTRPGICYRSLDSIDSFPGSDEPAVLVIAAPAPSSTIARVAAAYRRLTRVIDLRAEAEADPPGGSVARITLRDLFASMDDASRVVLTRVDAARAEIADRSRRYEVRDEVRPFGLEDLCT